MMLYKVLLVCFMLGAIFSGLNESGLYSVNLPESGAGITEAQVTEYGEEATAIDIGPFSVIMAIWTFVKVFFAAVVAMISLVPLFFAYGMPVQWLWIPAMMEAPLHLIKMIGVYQILTGHQMEGMS